MQEDWLLDKGELQKEERAGLLHRKNECSGVLSRIGLSLFARRRPIDIVAELVERLGCGTAE